MDGGTDPLGAWRLYSGGIAWPTIVLSLFVTAVWWMALLGHVVGFWSTPTAFAMATVAAYCSLTPAHEAAHQNISGRRLPWLDLLVGQVSLLCLLGPFLPFRTVHLRHHAHVNDTDRDPDMWMAVDAPRVAFRAATILPYYWFNYWFPPPGVPEDREHRRYAIAFFGLLGAAFASLLSTGHAATIVWVMVVPAWLALGVLALVFTWLPHSPHHKGDRYRDTRARPGVILDWLLLGQNLHLIHHLWPTVPWFHYRDVFVRTADVLRARGADVGDAPQATQRQPRASASNADRLGNR